MAIVINAVQSVFSIILMISVGYILALKGWFSSDVPKLFSRILIEISIPALLIANITANFNKDKLISSGIGLLAVIGTIVISYAVSTIVSKILKVSSKRRGVFSVLFAFSNTVFIGLPVNLALFGEGSVPFALLYYLVNTSLFWTIGVYGIRQDSASTKVPIFTIDTLKKIVTPPIIAFGIAVIIIMAGVKIPSFLNDVFKYMGNMSTPLSMIYLGIVVQSIGIKGLRFDKEMAALLAGRFVVTPLLVFLFLQIIPIPELMRKVFIIQSAMPVMAQSAILAQQYDADHEFATAAVTMTTAASLIFIPMYMFLIS